MINATIEMQMVNDPELPTSKGSVDLFFNKDGIAVIRDEYDGEYKLYDERTGRLIFRKDINNPGGVVGLDNNLKINKDLLPDVFINKEIKDLPGGYAGLDINGKVSDSVIPDTIERTENKGKINGYAPLDSNVKVPLGFIPDTVELRENRNRANGYAGLNARGKIEPSQLPGDLLLSSNTVLLRQIVNNASYPPGSLYCNFFYKTNPATILGVGRWRYIGEGRHIVADNQNAEPAVVTTDETDPNYTRSFVNAKISLRMENIPIHRHVIGDLHDPVKTYKGAGTLSSADYEQIGFTQNAPGTTNPDGTTAGTPPATWGAAASVGYFTSSYQTLKDVEPGKLNAHTDVTDIKVDAIKMFIWYRLPDTTGDQELDQNNEITRVIHYTPLVNS